MIIIYLYKKMSANNSEWFAQCPSIYNAFGADRLNNLPILNLGDARGATDYIDFIRAEDMQFPIMIGKDCFARPFLAIKFIINDSCIVGTFFQRYSDDYQAWAFGTTHMRYGVYHDSRIRLDDYKPLEQRLKNLLDGVELRELACFDKNFNIEIGNGANLVTLAA